METEPKPKPRIKPQTPREWIIMVLIILAIVGVGYAVKEYVTRKAAEKLYKIKDEADRKSRGEPASNSTYPAERAR